ncbi:hypothetical protein CH76_11925 [Lysinibacillus sp. BF-4]|uniref:Uncharacterized protein n=1 Tax=Metalysinibacillus saudimassiliensis TaxID=1461583 RepID=A0A078M509_9BACL|nr:hypothetical protein [Lysinibacillus sp. BF-4]KFL42514.1 hypothetical protein CH76_11925 [Lysinibacillus sp. BF-4]CEA01294.1 hypothetical protein BN1050_00857 [Metalysinibacillus saudimassiliensis]
MEQNAANTTNILILNLLVTILEERGIMTEKELKERLTNQVKLDKTMEPALRDAVLAQIKQHH